MTDLLLAAARPFTAARLFDLFAGLTVAFAGLAIGLCVVLIGRYWFLWRKTRSGDRLIPAHVMLIGTSYAMLAVAGVVRLGSPPSIESRPLAAWLIYPWITVAFLIGDIALLVILRFIGRRGARVGPHPWTRRSTDPPSR